MRACRRTGLTMLAVALGASMLLGAVACSSDTSTGGSSGLEPSDDPALDAGRVLVESKCDMCHTLDRIENANKDGTGWADTVARMRGNGAVLTDEEAQQIVDYLASR